MSRRRSAPRQGVRATPSRWSRPTRSLLRRPKRWRESTSRPMPHEHRRRDLAPRGADSSAGRPDLDRVRRRKAETFGPPPCGDGTSFCSCRTAIRPQLRRRLKSQNATLSVLEPQGPRSRFLFTSTVLSASTFSRLRILIDLHLHSDPENSLCLAITIPSSRRLRHHAPRI